MERGAKNRIRLAKTIKLPPQKPTNLLKNVNNVTIAISHNHSDHCNLKKPFESFLDQLNKKRNTSGKCRIKLSDIDLSKIGDLSKCLGDSVSITPFVANNGKSIHDKCLALKVRANQRTILLTGDASGNSCQAMKNSIGISDINILLLSHHGSNREDELSWFESCINNKSNNCLLSIISSSPYGQAHIPAYETVVKLLSSYSIMSILEMGCYFCACHSLDCYHSESEEIITFPAVSSATSIPLPVFISSKSMENDGDGVYRICIQKNGDIRMRNNALSNNFKYIYSSKKEDSRIVDLIRQMHLVQEMQKAIFFNCQKELKNITDTSAAGDLQKLRGEYSKFLISLDSYLSKAEILQRKLERQNKIEKKFKQY